MIDCILILLIVIIIILAVTNIIKYNFFNAYKYYTDPILVYGIIATIIGIGVNYLITNVFIKDWCEKSLLKQIIIETLIILFIKNIVLSFINLKNLFNIKWLKYIGLVIIIHLLYIKLVHPLISNCINLKHKHKKGHIHCIIYNSTHNIIIFSIIKYIVLFLE